ncbi:MAG TPA: hypothetical protein VLM40_16360 [Gemmata sp.]|nr:hypothetical protein [Gemmata sp.]
MAATEQLESATGRGRTAVYACLGLLAAGALVVLLAFLNRSPQMGADEEVFRTVDALFTATTARDEKRLAECEGRLHTLRDEGRLPESAAKFLDEVIARARSGRWETAAEKLYSFMLDQRREGAEDHPPPRQNIQPKPSKAKRWN